MPLVIEILIGYIIKDMDAEEKKEEKNAFETLQSYIDENRVINFSDAVFAFAATLLVLKIDLPGLSKEQLSGSFLQILHHLWPQYFANIISFLIIGYYWLNHHVIFAMLKKFDRGIVWINLVFLIFLSFLPFPVDLFGDFSDVPVVIAFYSISLALVGYLLVLIWVYASYKHRLVDPKLSSRHITYYLFRILVAPVVFTIAAPLAFVDPLLARLSWIFVLIGLFAVGKFFNYKRMSEMEKSTI